MTSGGKYILETNLRGESQEKILYNIKLLESRLKDRCNEPLLLSLDNTHANFIKSYYKPVIPMSYEFRSDQVDAGDLSFNKQNIFSLPLYGDFICQMYLHIKLTGLSVKNNLDRCGYVDFIGHRIMENVVMDFAGNIVDEYSYQAYNVFYNYFVTENEKLNWLRAVGQEVPVEVTVQQSDSDNYREIKRVVNGAQTPKTEHNEIHLNIPIIFDFSRKLTSPIFSAKIPFGQRFLKITLAKVEKLIYSIDNGGGGALNLPQISGELWSNQIFVMPQITANLIPGLNRTFLRVFKESKFTAQVGHNIQKLDDLRFPTEALYFGLHPQTNTSATNWYKYHSEQITATQFPVCLPPNQIAVRSVNIASPKKILQNIKFLSRGIEITRPCDSSFFNVIQPYYKSISPTDPGLNLLCFARDTLTEQPTAFFNISIDREYFIEFDSEVAGDFYILAYCLNWLEIDENGTVNVKYKI